jgi:uncharacterized protein (DUF305 family)
MSDGHRRRRWPLLAGAVLVLAAAGCTPEPADPDPDPAVVQPGAPGEPGRTVDPGQPAGTGGPGYTVADVVFVHSMVPHHAQALELTGLVADRTGNREISLLARRIEASQADEIALMEDWLAAHGMPAGAGEHQPGERMPGMLTDRQLAELAAASGPDFDRLFLDRMIYHHEGALTMVEQLFGGGGGQAAEIFQLASHIDSDQRVEIDRMRRMLVELPAGSR